MVTFISLSLNVSFMLEPKQRRHPFIFMPQLDSLKLNKCEWPNTGNVFFKVFLFSVHIQISFYWHIRHFKPVWHSAPTWNDRKMIADDDDTIKACFYLLKPAAVNVHHIALCLDLSAAHIFIYFDLLGLGFMCQPHSLRTKSGPAHSWEWSPNSTHHLTAAVACRARGRKLRSPHCAPIPTQLHEWDPDMFHLCFQYENVLKMETWLHNNPKQKTLTSVTFSGMPETAGVTMETQLSQSVKSQQW